MSVLDRQMAPGLPVYFTRFIGRSSELAELEQLVVSRGQPLDPGGCGSRLVTLVGVGGSGKTRLAVQLADRLSTPSSEGDSVFPDGVCWVDLAPLADSKQLPRAVGAAVGLPESSADPATAVRRALADARSLMVLDNCEEMTGACEQLATDLLMACPRLMVVATSRTSLHVAGCVEFTVTPLSSAARDSGSGALARSEAAELFYDRAALVAPAYPVLEGDDATIESLCRLLDGVPLAIELAAPWVRVLSARDLLSRTDHSLDVLASTSPTLTSRHRSMRAVLDSTWHGLSDAERRVLRGLGLFVGGFSLEAAQAVAGATLSDLATLTERSLISRVPQSDRGTRYGMHEVIRQYAVERLTQLPDADLDRLHQQHLDYFVRLAEGAKDDWETDQEPRWLERLRREDANVGAALTWALNHEKGEAALRLCAAIYRVWIYSAPPGHYTEVVERSLALPWDHGSPTASRARARTLEAAGYAALELGDLERGARYFKESIVLYQQLAGDGEAASCIRGYSFTVSAMGDHRAAERYARQSLAICRRVGDLAGLAWSYKLLGELAFARGDLGEVPRLIADGLAGFEQLENEFGSYCSYVFLGNTLVVAANWRGAVEAYRHSLALRSSSNFTVNGRLILVGLAEVAVALGQPERAAMLFGASQGPAWGNERSDEPWSDARNGLATAQHQLGDDWEPRFEAGRQLTPAQVAATTNDAVTELAFLSAAPEPHGLTAREIEVMQLVAQGLGNTDVADHLSLSPRTVHAHLRSIFAKFGVTTRTGAVHEAARAGLLQKAIHRS